jgi:hypothetical protein
MFWGEALKMKREDKELKNLKHHDIVTSVIVIIILIAQMVILLKLWEINQ